MELQKYYCRLIKAVSHTKDQDRIMGLSSIVPLDILTIHRISLIIGTFYAIPWCC